MIRAVLRQACNEFVGPISTPLHSGNTALLEEMSQRWRAVGNIVTDLTDPKIEPQISRSRDEQLTARPTDRYFIKFRQHQAMFNQIIWK